ncbi:flippase [Patescibacteria group bacterium]
MAETVESTAMESPKGQSTKTGDSGQDRILKNTSFLTVAFIIQKAISFLFFVFVARRLGPIELGLFDPLKSLIPISLILIDFSLSAVLTREIARAPERKKEYLNNVLGVKLIFALLVMIIAGLVTIFGNFDPATKSLLYLIGIIVALDTFTLTFFAVFRGLQNLKYESIAIIFNQLIAAAIGIAALLLGYGLTGLFIAILAGSVFNFIFAVTILKKKTQLMPMPSWDLKVIKPFLKIAIPFAIAAIFVKVFTYTDRYMILALAGKQYVGWYTSAHKLTFALEFIPSAFAASVYPAMSAFYVSSKEYLRKSFEKTIYFLMVIAIPLSVGMFALADRLVVQLFTKDFEASIVPLRIMIAGLVFIFMNFPVGALLNACNRQKRNTINMGITVAINIILNAILIPKFTFVGAAIATLISTSLLFFLGLYWVGKIIPWSKKRIFILFGKSVISAFIMGVAVKVIAPLIVFDIGQFFPTVGSYVQIIAYYGIIALIGAVIYFVVLYLLKGISKNDFMSVYQSIVRKVS